MGKQVKRSDNGGGWTPPADAVEETQSVAWIPPDDAIADESVKKKDDPAIPSASASGSVGPGQPSGQSSARPTPTARLQQNVDNFVTASKNRFAEEAEQKRSEFQKIVDAEPAKTDSVNIEYQKFLSDREKAYNADLDKQIEVLSEQFRKETAKPISTPEIIKEIVSSTSGPIGSLVYDFGRRIWSGFADDIPKSLVQGLEVAKSSVSPLNVQEYIRNNKPVDFQRYVREKEGIPWYQSFGQEGFDKYLGKYADQFMKDKGLQDVAQKIKANEPKVIERRLKTEELAQQQKIESAEKMGGAVQSFKDIKSLDDLASYIGTLGGQAAYQIPLSVLSRGSSSLLQESATVYDQQLDNLATDHGITREEVIKRGLDKPAEGQAYAVLAASLDRLSAGNIISAFKQGGGSIAKKWAKTAIPEAITEPTQGILEDVGSATGSKTEALGEALTSSKRIDEFVGGLVGGTPGAFATGPAKSVADVVNEEKANITNPADQISVEAAAEKIEKAIEQDQTIPDDTKTIQGTDPNIGRPEGTESPTGQTESVLPVTVEQTSDQTGDGRDVETAIESDEVVEAPTQPTTPKSTMDLQKGDMIEVKIGDDWVKLPIRRVRKDSSTWQGKTEDRSKFYVLPPGRDDVLGAEVEFGADEVRIPEETAAEVKSVETPVVEQKQDAPDTETTERIAKLDEHESDGYDIVRKRELKELMTQMPDRARLAFQIMDFTKKVWPKDLADFAEKNPLASLSQFFYGDANSLDEWVDMQIKGEEMGIEGHEKTIKGLKAKKNISKSDKASIGFWQQAINGAQKRITQYRNELENTKQATGSGNAVQPVIGESVPGTTVPRSTDPIEGGTDNSVQQTPAKELSPSDAQQPANAPSPTDEVSRLKKERDDIIRRESKPDVKVELVPVQEIVDSGNPIQNKKTHDRIKEKSKALKSLIDCLWTT